jgi:hypothetical protein
MVEACNGDGRFVYKTHLTGGPDESGDYNMLRHSGAIYALGMCQARWPDEATADAMARASQYLMDSSVGPVPGETGLLAVWTRPEIVGEGASHRAKLGGAGLGLVALVSSGWAQDATQVLTLRQLALFLLFMQEEDGGFVSRFDFEEGQDDSFTSLYYPGEAALGLMMLYEIDPQPEWLQGAADAMAFLARTRQGRTDAPPDHWALIATGRLLPHLEKCPRPVSRELLLSHAAQVCQSMLDEYNRNQFETPRAGCFTNDGRTTPTATRIEGLLAALTYLPADQAALKARIRKTSGEAVAFLLSSQVTGGLYEGAIPRAIGPLGSDHPASGRAFNRRAGEVRIDYVQHALSAMVQYRDLLAEGAQAQPGGARQLNWISSRRRR